MNEMSLEGRRVFWAAILGLGLLGSWAALPVIEPQEPSSFVRVPGPAFAPLRGQKEPPVVPVYVIDKEPAVKQDREVPWFSWRNVG